MSERFDSVLDRVLRNDGFRKRGDTWVRQNLTSHGLVDMFIRSNGAGQYDVTVWAKDRRASVTRDADGVLNLVAAFLAA